jgi:peptidoglycan/xylan/chitin deacetylase (PgdA/CDA1 family)
MSGSGGRTRQGTRARRLWLWVGIAAGAGVLALFALPRLAHARRVALPVLAAGQNPADLSASPAWRWAGRAPHSAAYLRPVGDAGADRLWRRGSVWRPARALIPGRRYRLEVRAPVQLLGYTVGWQAWRTRRDVRAAPRPRLAAPLPPVAWPHRVLRLRFDQPLRSVRVTDGAGAAVAVAADRARRIWRVVVPDFPPGVHRLTVRYVGRAGAVPGPIADWRLRLVGIVTHRTRVVGGAAGRVTNPMQAVLVDFARPMGRALPAAWAGDGVWIGPRRLELLPPGGWSGRGDFVRTLGPLWDASGSAVAPAVRLTFHLPKPVAPREVWFGPSAGNRIYLTIDDGWFPSAAALDLLARRHIPFTTFLIGRAVREDPAFWRRVEQDEGFLGDHTYSHVALTTLTDAGIRRQVVRDAAILERLGGVPPTWMRPPYGAVNARVLKALGEAGVARVVMWSAVVDRGRISTWNGRPLGAGEIVLVHWVPGLERDLRVLMRAARAAGLTFAALPGVPARGHPAAANERRSVSMGLRGSPVALPVRRAA